MDRTDYKFFTLAEALDNSCENEEHFVTFINGESDEVRLSYKSLRQKALEYLAGLQKLGLCEGDEVVIQLDDNESFLCVFWACILGKLIPVPVAVGNSDEHRLKLFKIWDILNKPFLISGGGTLEKLRTFSKAHGLDGAMREIEAWSASFAEIDSGTAGRALEAKPEDIAFIQFSSGSTGDPKGVVMTHENLATNMKAMLGGIGCSDGDSTLSWMPLTHDMGLIGFHLAVLAGNIDQFLMPTSLFIRRPTLWMQKAAEHGVTILSSPNFGLKYFTTYHKPEALKGLDLSGVRLIFNGAEPINADGCREFLDGMEKYKFGGKALFNVYGMAEAGLAVSFPPVGEGLVAYDLDRGSLKVGDRVRPASGDRGAALVDLGSAVEGCAVRICGRDGEILGGDTVGLIEIKGKNVTSGYYNDEEETRRVMTDDGWLKTGDVGFLRNGRLVVTGREKDIIFLSGQNFYPHDLENAISGLEGAQLGRAAACGVYSGKTGTEEVVVFVRYKKEPASFLPLASQIRRLIGEKFGIEVAGVVPVPEIPKTTSGKLRRYKLGEDYVDGKFAEVLAELDKLAEKGKAPDGQYGADVAKILAAVGEVLGKKDIGADDDFFDLGVDSIKALQIVSALGEKGMHAQVNDILEHHSARELCGSVDFETGNLKGEGGTGARPEAEEKTGATSEQSYLVQLNQKDVDELFE